MRTTASKKTTPRVPAALEGLIDRHGQLTDFGWGAVMEGLETALDRMASDDDEETDGYRVLYAILFSTASIRL
jgi:hypothetical protein